MNRSGSHPNHENRQIIFSTVLIRRGGAPSGAAAFIIFGGMGVSTPISNSRRPIFMRKHLILTMTLSGASPLPLGHPPYMIMPYYLNTIVEEFLYRFSEASHAPPRSKNPTRSSSISYLMTLNSPMGQDWRREEDIF